MPRSRFQAAPPRVPRDRADLVGQPPLTRLPALTAHLPASVELYAKAEWFNPSGSVKDRPALSIIRAAEAAGQLTPDKVLLDSTSGNMGIAYATLGRALGHPIEDMIARHRTPFVLGEVAFRFTRPIPYGGPGRGLVGGLLEERRAGGVAVLLNPPLLSVV